MVGSLRKLALFAGWDSAHFPTSRNWSHLDSFQTLASRSEPVFGRGQVPVSASFFSAEATCGEALGQFLCPFGRLTELCWNYRSRCWLSYRWFWPNNDLPSTTFSLLWISRLSHSTDSGRRTSRPKSRDYSLAQNVNHRYFVSLRSSSRSYPHLPVSPRLGYSMISYRPTKHSMTPLRSQRSSCC